MLISGFLSCWFSWAWTIPEAPNTASAVMTVRKMTLPLALIPQKR
jgi:hypothetical protein